MRSLSLFIVVSLMTISSASAATGTTRSGSISSLPVVIAGSMGTITTNAQDPLQHSDALRGGALDRAGAAMREKDMSLSSRLEGLWNDPVVRKEFVSGINPFDILPANMRLQSGPVEIRIPVTSQSTVPVIPSGTVNIRTLDGLHLVDINRKVMPGEPDRITDALPVNPSKNVLFPGQSMTVSANWEGMTQGVMDESVGHITYQIQDIAEYFSQTESTYSDYVLPWNKRVYTDRVKMLEAVVRIQLVDPQTGKSTDLGEQIVPFSVPYTVSGQKLNTGLIFWGALLFLIAAMAGYRRRSESYREARYSPDQEAEILILEQAHEELMDKKRRANKKKIVVKKVASIPVKEEVPTPMIKKRVVKKAEPSKPVTKKRVVKKTPTTRTKKSDIV